MPPWQRIDGWDTLDLGDEPYFRSLEIAHISIFLFNVQVVLYVIIG